jgi:hypothetical protein
MEEIEIGLPQSIPWLLISEPVADFRIHSSVANKQIPTAKSVALISLPASLDSLWAGCHSPTGNRGELCPSGYWKHNLQGGVTNILAKCHKTQMGLSHGASFFAPF